MQLLPTLTVLVAFLRASRAFHIPEGAHGGVYSVRTYENGTEEHTRIGNLVASPAVLHERSSIYRRQYGFSTPECFPDEGTEDLDHGDTDAANAALQSQCGGGATIARQFDFYSISGCVVAYACNFNAVVAVSCYAAESVAANQQTTDTCGAYKPGSTTDQLSVAYGYENYCTSWGHNFCGRACREGAKKWAACLAGGMKK